jgi:hypothetical protein
MNEMNYNDFEMDMRPSPKFAQRNEDVMDMRPSSEFVQRNEDVMDMRPSPEFVQRNEDVMDMRPSPEFVRRNDDVMDMRPINKTSSNGDVDALLERTPSETYRQQIERLKALKQEVENSRDNGISR